MRICKAIGCSNALAYSDPTNYSDYCYKCRHEVAAIAANDALQPAPDPAPNAMDFMRNGLGHMEDRAAQYDSPDGERSMGTTVAAFNIFTGHSLTETEGWKFMECLKMARSCQGEFKEDTYEDRAAYAALAGESHAREEALEV